MENARDVHMRVERAQFRPLVLDVRRPKRRRVRRVHASTTTHGTTTAPITTTGRGRRRIGDARGIRARQTPRDVNPSAERARA
jgi:hypothetical protein